MKTWIVWGLVGVNAVLLGLLMSHYVRENTAQAQVAGGRPGEYILCPGVLSGVSSEIVYVLDTLNGQMGAVSYDVNGSRLATMPAIDLNRTFQSGAPLQGPGVPRPGATGTGGAALPGNRR